MIDPEDLAERLAADDPPLVLDVRDEDEFSSGHIPGSIHIPFGQLGDRLDEVPRDREIAAVCSGGKRSGLAASLLQREGYERLIHVAHGGVGTWERQGRQVERGRAPG
jgi:hydroxyacylglutathione hydrolase